MALGTQAYATPTEEIAEGALARCALFVNLPQWMASQLGPNELHEFLRTNTIQLTSEKLEFLPRSPG